MKLEEMYRQYFEKEAKSRRAQSNQEAFAGAYVKGYVNKKVSERGYYDNHVNPVQK